MHKAWQGIGEVPHVFFRQPIKFHGHAGLKIDDFDQTLAFPDCLFPGWLQNDAKAWRGLEEMGCPFVFAVMHKALRYMVKVLCCFGGSSVIFQSHRPTNERFHRFGSNLSRITRPAVAIKSLNFALVFFHDTGRVGIVIPLVAKHSEIRYETGWMGIHIYIVKCYGTHVYIGTCVCYLPYDVLLSYWRAIAKMDIHWDASRGTQHLFLLEHLFRFFYIFYIFFIPKASFLFRFVWIRRLWQPSHY